MIDPKDLTIEGIYDELKALPKRPRSLIAELLLRTQKNSALAQKYEDDEEIAEEREITAVAHKLNGGRLNA